MILLAIVVPAPAGPGGRGPDLTGCEELAVPGHKVAFHAYAAGVQVYRWNGAGWDFVGPEAELFADAEGHGVVGIHYGGPTWESHSGGKVVGAVVERCTVDPDSIPWLKLSAVSSGPGIFHRVTFIQRVNTVDGLAPDFSGASIGEEVRVPYTAEYYFYRPQ